MFFLLAVPGQVIPAGSESPFCAAGLCWCRAWNPITSAAMLALWHQTPSMQNATAGVYQRLVPQLSYRRGVHWWVAWLTRGRRDDTGDTDEGERGVREGMDGLERPEKEQWVWITMTNIFIWSLGWMIILTAVGKWLPLERGDGGDLQGSKMGKKMGDGLPKL